MAGVAVAAATIGVVLSLGMPGSGVREAPKLSAEKLQRPSWADLAVVTIDSNITQVTQERIIDELRQLGVEVYLSLPGNVLITNEPSIDLTSVFAEPVRAFKLTSIGWQGGEEPGREDYHVMSDDSQIPDESTRVRPLLRAGRAKSLEMYEYIAFHAHRATSKSNVFSDQHGETTPSQGEKQ